MLRSREQLVRRALLDDPSGIHDANLVGQPCDDAQIVRDQEKGHAPLVLLASQELEQLRLDRDVERGGRLVCDQQLRVRRKRDRDSDPLAQPARELVRVLREPPLGLGDADFLKQLDGSLARLVASTSQVRPRGSP